MPGQRVASLEFLFEMATGQAISEVVKFGGAIDKTMLGAIKAANDVDAALEQIGAGAGMTAAQLRREYNMIERAGESMVREIEREIAVFGKSSAEIRIMRTELAAAAAEQRGMTELAGRLRMVNGTLIEMQGGQGGVTRSSGAMRSGMQQLGFQLNDVATSFQGGIAPMTIFAQQGSQVIQAIQLMSGESKGLIGFLGGPWGAILTAATVVLAPMVMKLWEGSDAADKETASLSTLAGSTAALDAATGRANRTKEESIQLSLEATRQNYGEAISLRQVLAARLAGFNEAGATEGGAMAGIFGLVTERQIAANEKIIADSQRALKGADFAGIVRQVGAETDKTTAATQRYEAEVSRLKTAVVDHNMSQAQAHKELLAAQRALDAVRNADQLAASAKRDHNKEVRDAAKVHREAAKAAKDDAKDEIDAARDVYQAGQSLRDTLAKGGGLVATGDVFAGLRDIKPPDLFGDMDDEIARIVDQVDRLGSSMEQAFGRAGGAIGDAMSTLAEYGRQQDLLARQAQDEQWSDGKLIKANADLQLNTMLGLTHAARGLFKEHSAGAKAMEAAEKALTIVQLARTVVSLQLGAANMFAAAGPGGFPLVPAMFAVMAGLGYVGLSGGGSGKAPVSNTGVGTVFGDTDAKSESIQRSLDLLNDLDAQHLHYATQMAATLRSIDQHIGGLASLLVRTGGIDASAGVETGFTTNGYGKAAGSLIDLFGITKGIPIVGDILGAIKGAVQSLFGTKTSVVGNGLFGGAQALGDIVTGGIDLSNYSDIERKKKFLGITTGKSYTTQFADADSEIERQFGQILTGFYETIAAAAPPLGVATGEVESRLNGFVVDLGRIDLKGLSGAEISEKLTAVFGAAADDIARAAFPGLEAFQQVGEGYFETLTRVAASVETVTTSLRTLGLSAESLGIETSMAIVGMFDSASDYASAANAYFAAFYSEAEQSAAKTAQLADALGTLGLALPDSIAAYRRLVEAQDLTTAAGQEAYAGLLKLAPAFADLNKATEGAVDGTASAAAVMREREGLERQLLQLGGDVTAIRADELAQLAPANRVLQERIYLIKDQQAAEEAAAAAAKAIGDERLGLERQLMQINGDTAALRALDLAKIDVSNQALQLRIWALQDEAAATEAATTAIRAANDERAGLARQLLEAQGDTGAIRQQTLAALLSDEARQTQQQIWDIQDRAAAQQAAAAQAAEDDRVRQQAAEEAARAAQQLADAWRGIADSLLDEVKRIRGMTTTGALSFAQLQGQFNDATISARLGDQDAGKALAGISRDLLDRAAEQATSRQELLRVQAITASSLEETARLIDIATGGTSVLAGFGSSTEDDQASAPAWWGAAAAGNGASSNNDSATEVRSLRAEVAGMREDMRSVLSSIAGSSAQTAGTLNDVTRDKAKLNVRVAA